MKRIQTFLLRALFPGFLLLNIVVYSQKQYKYESVPGDPMQTRIYTLDNGLKAYLTVYKDEPRIMTAIAVRTGSKNDPTDNTGLSHYLEHMMFKGTQHYGTKDFSKEKPFLDQIDSLFEVYRTQKDTLVRKYTYHLIDSVSGLAAKAAIANEYDKMMGMIGAKGTNAFTSVEQTVYINDIPSNQVETWLTIESDRFTDPVFRIFHTELEAVYEEKNMSIDNDGDKEWEALYAGLFQKHTYGTQTTIGTIEHLKNPSLIALEKYYSDRYVPNNIAICMSGDFDPDMVIALIDKNFGSLPRKEIKAFVPPVEDPITQPIVKEVWGPDAENMMLAFRFSGANTHDADLLEIMDMILSNSTAGLIDLNLVLAQKVLYAGTYADVMKDYSAHIFYGAPKQGQTMEQVKDLLLSQIDLVKKGEFPDWLIPAIVNDIKLSEIKKEESNNNRCFSMVGAFILETPWQYELGHIGRLEKITKQDIVDFANKYYNNNYVVVYKRTGEDKNVVKVTKPTITPVEVNRDEQSEFLKKIQSIQTNEIEPVFVDYNKDFQRLSLRKDLEILYKANTENDIFRLYYVFNMGTDNNKKLDEAVNYLSYLGTSTLTPTEVQQEFYKIGCSTSVYASEDQVYVSLSGLAENMQKGLVLFENLLADAQPNAPALKNMVADILKERSDAKLSKDEILWSAMYDYGMYGAKSPYTNILSAKELKKLKAQELVDIIHNLNSYPHRILYYGPTPSDDVSKILSTAHKVPDQFIDIPQPTVFEQLPTTENKVYVVDYDMKQVEIIMLSRSDVFNKSNVPIRRVFNEYFGGGMGSIVFQELRESKALAYSAFASYTTPNRPERHHYIFSYIGTQNDKLPEAMKGMTDLINNMPKSEKSFQNAKDAVIRLIRTNRTTKSDILFSFLTIEKMGLDHDMARDVYQQVPNMTFDELQKFQETYLKDKNYTILVLGKKDKLDIKTLEKYGKIEYLKLEDIFGY
jgi:predicted Zn-dependent peptidase